MTGGAGSVEGHGQSEVTSIESDENRQNTFETAELTGVESGTHSIFQKTVRQQVDELSTSTQAVTKAVAESTDYKLHSSGAQTEMEGFVQAAKEDVRELKNQWDEEKSNHIAHLKNRMDKSRKELRKNQDGRSKNPAKQRAYSKAEFRLKMITKYGCKNGDPETPTSPRRFRRELESEKQTLEKQLKSERNGVKKLALKDAISVLDKEIKSLSKTKALKTYEAFRDMKNVANAAEKCTNRIINEADGGTVKSQRRSIKESKHDICQLHVSSRSKKASKAGHKLAQLIAGIDSEARSSISAIRSDILKTRKRQAETMLAKGTPRDEIRFRARISDLASRKTKLDAQIEAWHERADKLKANKPKSGFLAKARYERRWRSHEKKGQKLAADARDTRRSMGDLEWERKNNPKSITPNREAPPLPPQREAPSLVASTSPANTPQTTSQALETRLSSIMDQVNVLEGKLRKTTQKINEWNTAHSDKLAQFTELVSANPDFDTPDEDIQRYRLMISNRIQIKTQLERLHQEHEEITNSFNDN